MKIRKFEETDRESVLELWEVCELIRPWNNPDKDITRKLSFQPNLFFVGELNGRVIASVMAGYDGHRGSVFYLAVAPTHQKLGYGRDLMCEVEKQLTAFGCSKLNIVVRSSNQKVLNFYSALGYVTDNVTSLGKRLISDA